MACSPVGRSSKALLSFSVLANQLLVQTLKTHCPLGMESWV
jgi:hypothetical protein